MPAKIVAMTTNTATGDFDLHDWQDAYYDETPAAKLARVTAAKHFHGDLDGTSALTLLTVGVPVEGEEEFAGVAYVGVERFTGSLAGRKGSFVLVHTADRAIGMSVAVVAGSADGELTGLRGDLRISRAEDGSHSYTFEYSFAD